MVSLVRISFGQANQIWLALMVKSSRQQTYA